MAMKTRRDKCTARPIVYFEEDGRANLPDVIKVIKSTMRKRSDLRTVVFFTANGEGPAVAFNQLQDLEPRIIAVTFPLTFFSKRNDEVFRPEIPQKVRNFFAGVRIPILTGRLPWDHIDGATAHNNDMDLIQKSLSIVGGSFPLCIQAVLQACDMGAVGQGEIVIGATGDCAAVVRATMSQHAFSKEQGVAVLEILCKSRNPTLFYRWASSSAVPSTQTALELRPSSHENTTLASSDASNATLPPSSQFQRVSREGEQKP